MTYMVWIGSINVSWWLLHEIFFRQNTIEKCIFDAQLMQGPFTHDIQAQNNTNHRCFNYQIEGIVKIKTRDLGVALIQVGLYDGQ